MILFKFYPVLVHVAVSSLLGYSQFCFGGFAFPCIMCCFLQVPFTCWFILIFFLGLDVLVCLCLKESPQKWVGPPRGAAVGCHGSAWKLACLLRSSVSCLDGVGLAARFPGVKREKRAGGPRHPTCSPPMACVLSVVLRHLPLSPVLHAPSSFPLRLDNSCLLLVSWERGCV